MLANISIWKIVDSFTVQHLTIAKGGSSFVSYIRALIRKKLEYQNNGKIDYFYYTDISGYILLFIGTLIHNEIIILNCCGLSKYTYKKMKEREENDLKRRNDTINTTTNTDEGSDKSQKTIQFQKTLSSQETVKSPEEKNYKCISSSLNDSNEF